MRWAEMTPRERDALVATRLMGWRDLGNGLIARFSESSPQFFSEDAVMTPPHYSNDMAAAWLVVQRMGRESFKVRCHFLETCLPQAVAQGKAVMEGNQLAWPDLLFLMQPSDICFAALQACGVAIDP